MPSYVGIGWTVRGPFRHAVFVGVARVDADSVEATVRAHQWDGVFGIGGCDKNVPGLLMGMVPCNVPSIFVYGGSALPGLRFGEDLNIVDTYEMIGTVLAGNATREELEETARSCLPTAGACAGQYTANTMGMVSEAIGLAPLGSSMVPAVFSARFKTDRHPKGHHGMDAKLPVETLMGGGSSC